MSDECVVVMDAAVVADLVEVARVSIVVQLSSSNAPSDQYKVLLLRYDA